MEELNAIKIVELLNNVVQDIKSKKEQLNSQLSEYDLQQQDILHFIENQKLNATQISKLIKMLKQIRSNRRDVKNELARYSALAIKLSNGSNLLECKIETKPENEYYEFKTDVLNEYFGFSLGSKMYFGDTNKVDFTTSNINAIIPTPTLNENVATPEYVREQIEETINTKVEDDNDTNTIEAIMDHPEGKKIIITNIQTGKSVECKNFESAVMNAIGGSLASKLKPSELVKNVSGAMKAIKLGTEYLGFRWEVKIV